VSRQSLDQALSSRLQFTRQEHARWHFKPAGQRLINGGHFDAHLPYLRRRGAKLPLFMHFAPAASSIIESNVFKKIEFERYRCLSIFLILTTAGNWSQDS
jgi:hypothetical protein